MDFPPLDKRTLAVLEEERRRLQNTLDRCTEILAPNISPIAGEALARINDAIEAIGQEIVNRAGA